MSNLILPANERIEQAIIGAVLDSVNAMNYCLATLEENDFYFPKNRLIFREIFNFYKRNFTLNFELFIESLRSSGQLEDAGGIKYLSYVYSCSPIALDYELYVKDLKNLTALRKITEAAKDSMVEACKGQTEADQIIQDLHSKLFAIQGIGTNDTMTMQSILSEFSKQGDLEKHMAWMRERVNMGLTPYTGIQSNYPILDRTLGFFRDGCIYYIGARTSMGKTTFMLNLINGICAGSNPPPIGIFSLEMPGSIITAKMLCLMADVKFSGWEDMVLNPDEYHEVLTQAARLKKLPLFIEDEEDITITKLRARARRLKQNYGIKIIFIDYLTRIKSDTKYSSKHLQVDEISKGLQSMAKELEIPVVCLAQLNRESAKRTDPTPNLSDFRESGSIEEDCDAAILIHRPDYYNPQDRAGQVQIIVAKNRIRGQLKKIAYAKSHKSEHFTESEEIGELVKQTFQKDERRNPYADD